MIRVFPVLGGASFRPEFRAVASPAGRQHLGIDLFAPEGTPLLAVDDGLASFGTDPLGGNVVNLRSPDGTRAYYAHLSRFEGGSRAVRAGEVIGYVGTTGNASGKPPHSHFEVHPGGCAAVDPYAALAMAPVARASAAVARASASSAALGLALVAAAGDLAWALSSGSGMLSRPRRRAST